MSGWVGLDLSPLVVHRQTDDLLDVSRNCSFNAASSGGASIINYHWDWDDETTTDTAGPTATHRYAYKATFRVHLAVTDANGNTGSVTQSVMVH